MKQRRLYLRVTLENNVLINERPDFGNQPFLQIRNQLLCILCSYHKYIKGHFYIRERTSHLPQQEMNWGFPQDPGNYLNSWKQFFLRTHPTHSWRSLICLSLSCFSSSICLRISSNRSTSVWVLEASSFCVVSSFSISAPRNSASWEPRLCNSDFSSSS